MKEKKSRKKARVDLKGGQSFKVGDLRLAYQEQMFNILLCNMSRCK